MVKTAAILFGIVFLAIGILGFVPSITAPDANGMPMLLGIFHVNTLHNIVHLASGAVALLCGMSGAGASRAARCHRRRLALPGFRRFRRSHGQRLVSSHSASAGEVESSRRRRSLSPWSA